MTGINTGEVERCADFLQKEGEAHMRGDMRDRRTVGVFMMEGGMLINALASENAALREKLEAAQARAYELAVAIMGGEDAPGYADSIATEVLVKQQRAMAADWLNSIPEAALQAVKDAEWDAALEAGYQACLTCDGALNNAGAAAMKVRALRRAAPTGGEG